MKTINVKTILYVLGLGYLIVKPFSLSSLEVDRTDWKTIKVDKRSAIKQAREVMSAGLFKAYYNKKRTASETRELVFTTIKNNMKNHTPEFTASFTRTILQSARHAKMDPLLLLSFIQTESQFNEKAVGSFGEIGLMQIRPETAKWIAKKSGLHWKGAKALKNPHYNVRIGIEYLTYLRSKFGEDGIGYISAYNMGPKNVKQLYKKNKVPYVYSTKIVERYVAFNGEL